MALGHVLAGLQHLLQRQEKEPSLMLDLCVLGLIRWNNGGKMRTARADM